MKIAYVLALFLTSPTFAAPLPADFCQGFTCSADQQSVQQDFRQGHAPDLAALPFVASGNCWHAGNGYDSDQAEFGYALLDTQGGDAFLSAGFTFAASENPYAAFSLADAQADAGGDSLAAYRKMDLQPGFDYVNFAPGNSPENQWQYWVAQNGGQTLLLASWGTDHNVFCRFTRNP